MEEPPFVLAVADKWNSRQLQAACVVSAGSSKTLCLAAPQTSERVCEILKENELGGRGSVFLFEEPVDFKKKKTQIICCASETFRLRILFKSCHTAVTS